MAYLYRKESDGDLNPRVNKNPLLPDFESGATELGHLSKMRSKVIWTLTPEGAHVFEACVPFHHLRIVLVIHFLENASGKRNRGKR